MSVRVSAPAGPDRPRRLDLARFRKRATRALRAVGHARSELSVALVGDREMAELNASWRGRPRATDVLSFSLVEGPHREHRHDLLGDVVIGLPVARKNARRRHGSLDDEVARLLIHGLLHLLGHDHEKAGEARIMQREERRVWRCVRDAEEA